LILGGTGLAGPFTTRYLVERGHQVTIFHRGKRQVDLPPAVSRIIVVPPGRLNDDGNYQHHWVVDTTRIRAELGYMELVPQEEALRRTVEWQWANPLEKYDPKDFDYTTEDAVLAELEHIDEHY
jgi:nucleoside-diphosphate-sugar epimerase